MNKLVIINNPFGKIISLLKNNDIESINFFEKEDFPSIFEASIENKDEALGLFFLKATNYDTKNFCMKIDKDSQNYNLGQKLLVQVVSTKDSSKKHPMVTSKIKLIGSYCILTTNESDVKFSKNITPALQKTILSYLEEHLYKQVKGCSLLIRSNLTENSLFKLEKEIITFKNLLLEAEKNKEYHLNNAVTVINQFNSQIEEIIVNTKAEAETLNKDLESYLEDNDTDINYYQSNAVYNQIFTELEYLLQNRFLEKNTEIVFIENEAFNFIDINFKGNTHNKKEEALFEANKIALAKIVYLIKLKQLSGQILIDTLKIKDKNNQKKLLEYFESVCSSAGLKANIFGFSRLFILELTVPKINNSLNHSVANVNIEVTPNINFSFFNTLYKIEDSFIKDPLASVKVEGKKETVDTFKKYAQTAINGKEITFIVNEELTKNDLIVK